MMYHVKFSKIATKFFSKLDHFTQKMIYGWIIENLEGCENPRLFGKPLKGNLNGYWRYRIGDYRLISQINDEEIIITVVEIGHRRDIYK